MKYSDQNIRRLIGNWLTATSSFDGLTKAECTEVEEDVAGMAASCHYAVIQGYSPWMAPGPTHDLLLVVWGTPETFDLFYMEEDQLMPVVACG